MQPCPAERRIGIAKPSADIGRKAPHQGGGGFGFATPALVQNLEVGVTFPNLQLGQVDPRLEFWVPHFGDTGLDGIVETVEPGLGFDNRHTLSVNFGFEVLACIVSPGSHGLKDGGEPAGCEHLVLHGPDDQFIDLVHADGMAAASAFGGALGAREVFVLPALAGAQHHAASAFLADGNAGQERQEVKPYNIRTTIISPGAVKTELLNTISDQDIKDATTKAASVGVSLDAFARMVAFAIDKPEDVDVNEILFRPTGQVG